MAQRIQLSRKAGFKLATNARSVARPHYFGNPYKVGDVYLVGYRLPFPVPSARTWEGPCGVAGLDAVRCADAATAVKWFRAWATLALEPRKIELLRGMDLACWCPLDEPCHADVLLQLANGERRYALHQAPTSVITVDVGNGPEQWTGAEWNAYVDRADRTGTLITARVLHIDLRAEVPPSNT